MVTWDAISRKDHHNMDPDRHPAGSTLSRTAITAAVEKALLVLILLTLLIPTVWAQTPTPTGLPAPTPQLSMDGMGIAASESNASTPNPALAVGTNFVVEAINSSIAVYNKSGTLVSGPTSFHTIFASNSDCAGGWVQDGNGIIYDRTADRWVVFGRVTGSVITCIAVSTTSDPTAGTWYVYSYPNANGDDAIKLGVWYDYYYEIPQAGSHIRVYDRTKMLAGDATASYISYDTAIPHFCAATWLQPAIYDGTAPPVGTGMFFAYVHETGISCNIWGHSVLRVFQFVPNWTTPSSSTMTEVTGSPFTVDEFSTTSVSTATGDNLKKFAPNYRLQYLYLQGQYESLVATHIVEGPVYYYGYPAAVRWYELRRLLPGGTWTLRHQGSYGNDGNFRWLPSASADRFGNLAVAYNYADQSTRYPGVRYFGHLENAATGVTQNETSAVTGSAILGSGFTGRWGDFNTLALDPVDLCTFWFAGEYVAAADTWSTRLVKFSLPGCTGAAVPTPQDCCNYSAAPTPRACEQAENGGCDLGGTLVENAVCQ
jgi:hypothetical protein